MIDHNAFRRLAAWSLDGPVTPDEELKLARHRAGCDACRAWDAALRADSEALAAPRTVAVPSAVDSRIVAALAGAPPRGGLSPVLVLLFAALVLAASVTALAIGSYVVQQRQPISLPDRPAVPAGWTVVVTDTRDQRVALPPYVKVSAADGSLVMANEPPNGSPNWFQVSAQGPLDNQHPPGVTLEEFLAAMIGPELRAGAIFDSVPLPSGLATRMRVSIHNGSPDDTQAVWYAIAVDEGVAVLWMTGRPQDFATHAADIELIPLLWEVGRR